MIEPLSLLRACQRLAPGECFYWEQPTRQVALVGAGTALSIVTEGSERFANAAMAWQWLREEAVIDYASTGAPGYGPTLVGGFGFDPLRARTDLWRDFPDGLLVLPRLLFQQRDQQATLTLSCRVSPTDNLDNLTNSLCAELTRLSPLLAGLSLLPVSEAAEAPGYSLSDIEPAEAWQELVAETVRAIGRETYSKVVLARSAGVVADEQPFSVVQTLQRLRQSYPSACVFALQRGSRAFVGATPERLVHARDGRLHTMALAGSAPRGANEEEDRQRGSELLASAKNRGEHEIVSAMIRDSLAPLCSHIWIADTPELLRLKNIQHLQTAIVGELQPGRTLLEALQALHPTPAVGGTPTEEALTYIREHEKLDRGWYAGPLGWVDLQDNGEFVVALRSALLESRRATLFAGCGIVKDSDPAAEYAESCLKLQVILRSLSGEE
jgi:isochorismate synthase